MDLQLGPEASLAWAGDSETIGYLAQSFVSDGDRNGLKLSEAEAFSRIQELNEMTHESMTSALESGQVELGVHVHTVLPDGGGGWGTAPKGRQAGDVGPCDAWSETPLSEGDPPVVEEVVAYGVSSAALLASRTNSELTSFTGHLPRTMEGKIAVVTDPESLNPEVTTVFSPLFAPTNLGSAYSECMHRIADHPPFEAWNSDVDSALAFGSGPAVIPGERVIGAMDEHLDVWADTSASAAARRFLSLLLNWRHAALVGDSDRPWVFTFHTHLYQLNPGLPASLDPTARQSSTREGGRLRGDLEAMSSLLDRFSRLDRFAGVPVAKDQLVDWIPPSIVETEGSHFQLSSGEALPPTELSEGDYPYLALLAERLENTHLVCEGQRGDVLLFGFSRCDSGWSWGSPGPGYGCQSGESPDGVFVLVPEAPTCLDVESSAMQVGRLGGAEMTGPDWCGGGAISVPIEGLIVEPSAGLNWMADSCAAWR